MYNLYGGPGTGKSTAAAGLFYHMKQAGISCKLVREHVKDWAWDGRSIRDWDQIYFLGKQIRRESMLYGRVPFVITDAPVLMVSFYAHKFSPRHLRGAVSDAVKGFYRHCASAGIVHRHIILRRPKPHDPNGRYQTEDEELADFVRKHMIGLIDGGASYDTTDEAIQDMCRDAKLNMRMLGLIPMPDKGEK